MAEKEKVRWRVRFTALALVLTVGSIFGDAIPAAAQASAQAKTSVSGVRALKASSNATTANATTEKPAAAPVTRSSRPIRATRGVVPAFHLMPGSQHQTVRNPLARPSVLPNTDPNLGYHYDIPTPDQCRAAPGADSNYGWRKNHYAYCQVFTGAGTFTDPEHGNAVIAEYQMRVTTIGHGSYDARSATLTLYVDQVSVPLGVLPPGADMTFSFNCDGTPAGSCETDSTPVTLPIMGWEGQSMSYTFTSPDGVGITSANGKNVSFADETFSWAGHPACNPAICAPGGTGSGPNGHLRFDGPGSPIMSHQLGATFEPVDSGDSQVVDTLEYQYNGNYNGISYAQVAHHLYVALNFPASTYPQVAGKSLPPVLTRMANTTVANWNRRNVTQPLCRNVWGDGYATAYSPGLECDEYPFASTYQGGPITVDGNPDPTRISVCPLAGADNTAGGNALQYFYQYERIFDETDHFAVAVTDVPTPAPTPAAALPCPTPNPALPGVGRMVYDLSGGGAFLTLWTALGTSTGVLGDPTSGVSAIAGGQVQTFTGGNVYWSAASGTHEVTGAALTQYLTLGGPTSALGFPDTEPYASGGGTRQDFQHGSILVVGSVVTVSYGSEQWVVGHAAHAGNDYPYETIGQFEHQNEGTDDWAEYYGQCDSFAAWKVYENLAGTPSLPPIVPDPGWIPSAAPGISPVNQNTWGNADNWGNMAPKFGYTVDQVPTPGAIVWWRNATADPQNSNLTPDPAHGMGGFGHVGYVTDVYPDGSITIEQYNLRLNGEYSVLHMAFGQSATDTSFNQGSFTVPWPAGFVHIGDGASGAAASPPEPANGTVSWSYPNRGSQLQVIGPGSPSAQFSTGDIWYNRAGHGETGAEMYTHTNGPTAVSTATWTPSGLSANACYRVDAFVPDNYSDNPIAVYTVNDATGTNYAAVNENDTTKDWSELGVFKTGSGGGLSVKLDDRGVTGLYVAADAMRFWQQADCSALGDASPIMMPNSYYPSGSWSQRSGHGFFGNEQYATTTGTLYPTKTATWSPPHLLAHACYDVSLYVPDNYSDNPAATYNTDDVYYGGNFWPTVDENIFTNQFAGIGTLESGSGGYLPVALENNGPSGDYVAADAAAFVLNPNCAAQNNGTSTFGQPTSDGIIGPGSPAVNFTTTGNWHTYLGFGWNNHQLYSPDNAGATATWTFNGTPGACYNVDAYIPVMGYADNTSAGYVVSSNVVGGLATVNQNTTGGWTGLSRLNAGSDGKITVKLTDNGNSGGYTGADAIRFTGC